MSDINTQTTKKQYLSDNEKMSDFSIYFNKKNKLNPNYLNSSMSDERHFQKFAIEYIKYILFKGLNCHYSENIPLNFIEYVQDFTDSEHTEQQNKLFHNIIALKNEKAQSQDCMFSGDFDMVINSISGKDIMSAKNKFQFNIYQYPGISIEENVNYCIIGEIKKDFYKDIKKGEIIKQFHKYAKILEFLCSKPNLNNLKKRIGLNERNKLLFFMVTDENNYNFLFMSHINKKFQEDIHSGRDYLDKLPNYFKIFDLISSIIPILLIFIPRTLDDNKGIYSSEDEPITILDLKKEIKSLRDNQQKMQQQINQLLGKKRMKKKFKINKEIQDESDKKEEENKKEKLLKNKKY